MFTVILPQLKLGEMNMVGIFALCQNNSKLQHNGKDSRYAVDTFKTGGYGYTTRH